MRKNKAEGELIAPPDTLRKKVGGKLGPANMEAIAKAEAALSNLSENFDTWICDEVDKLEVARKAVLEEGLDGDAGQDLFNAAHDLKGLGTTYGYPFVSGMADSLCKITLEKEVRAKASIELVSAHVDSIRAVVRSHIKTTNNPVGQALLKELSDRATEFLAKA
ncbi:MAG: Hpt domain-containing protein [Robiginitomaculum sp.]|nr:Hpt domain-containing protein [Robiginitomaculum sp.]MDQ7076339.1 Hpt domain-containing protein [Robiginitomaculum sp.]